MKFNARNIFLFVLALTGISFSTALVGCSSPTPVQQESAPSKYSLTGRVVSIDKAKEQVVIDAAEIPGFMSAMQMPYSVKNPNLLEPLAPEDQITADVIVTGTEVWLENIVVVKKPDQAKSPAPNDAKPAPPSAVKQK